MRLRPGPSAYDMELLMISDRQSRELLVGHLDEQQRRDFKRYDHFWVIATKPPYKGYVFQLKDGSSIVQYEDGRQVIAYHVWAEYADRYQSLLTQLLFLRANPQYILHTACQGGSFFSDQRGLPKMNGCKAVVETNDDTASPLRDKRGRFRRRITERS